MIYFVGYDIANVKRLCLIAKIMENYGIRTQRSFFQCEMDTGVMQKLKTELLSILDKKEDSLRLYPVCADCLKNTHILGNTHFFTPVRYEIL